MHGSLVHSWLQQEQPLKRPCRSPGLCWSWWDANGRSQQRAPNAWWQGTEEETSQSQWNWRLQVGWLLGCFSPQGFLRWLLSPSGVVSFHELSSKLGDGMKDQVEMEKRSSAVLEGTVPACSPGPDLLSLVQRFNLPPAKICCSVLTLPWVSLNAHSSALPLGCFMPSPTLSWALRASAGEELWLRSPFSRLL